MYKDIVFSRMPIDVVLYDEVTFNFVVDHWNHHLIGTCIYKNELCLFEATEPTYNHGKDEWDEFYAHIYSLTWWEKQKFKISQWLFEKCVGYHWSYKDGKKIAEKPNITWLTNFYYKFLN